jgi:hypothetical protein
MGFEAISPLRIATDADRMLGSQTLPQSVSICFENKFSRIDLEKTDSEAAT